MILTFDFHLFVLKISPLPGIQHLHCALLMSDRLYFYCKNRARSAHAVYPRHNSRISIDLSRIFVPVPSRACSHHLSIAEAHWRCHFAVYCHYAQLFQNNKHRLLPPATRSLNFFWKNLASAALARSW